jgi:plasmid stabilization system protein ParE
LKVDWSQAARRDILRITAFYRAIDPKLSIQMRLRIEAAPENLQDKWAIAPLVGGATRKWKIKRTPLLVFFVADGRTLGVQGVKHAREDWADMF